MAANFNSETAVAALRDDLAALRADVAGLIQHLKTDAANGARHASAAVKDGAGEIYDSAGQFYRGFAEKTESSALALGRQVEAQPVIAVLVALGLGYVGGRVMSK